MLSYEEDETGEADLMEVGGNLISPSVIEEWIGDLIKDISKSKIDELCLKIFELGPSSKEDLKFVTEDRVKGILSELRTARFVENLKELLSTEPSSSSRPPNRRRAAAGTFDDKSYVFDFGLIKGNLLLNLKKQERLSPSSFRELARIVGQFCKTTRPQNMHMTTYTQGITLSVCKKFSAALLDTFNGTVQGKGNKTLFDKVYNWIENQRPNRDEDSLSTATKRRKLSKAPCVINIAPIVDNFKVLENNKEILKNMFSQPRDTWNAVEIRSLLQESYPLQRANINDIDLSDSSQSIARMICNDWPYLFHPIGAAVHFTAGCEVNPNNALDKFLNTSVTALRYFLIHACGAEVAKIDIEMLNNRIFVNGSGNGDTRSLYLITLLEMLAVYFREDITQLIVIIERDMTFPTRGYSFNSDSGVIVPNTPCMVGKASARGPSRLSCVEFHIFVDSTNVAGPFSVLQCMRVIAPTFFMLGICYHNKISKTLEFYEKVLLGLSIEPPSKAVTKAMMDFELFMKKLKN